VGRVDNILALHRFYKATESADHRRNYLSKFSDGSIRYRPNRQSSKPKSFITSLLPGYYQVTMVKVEIVEEKEFTGGESPYASDSSSRTSSSASLSSVSSELSADETLFDRIAALVDIIPPTTRHAISSRISKTSSLLKRSGKIIGNVVWIVTTSALLVGLPLALSLEDEGKIVAQEREMLAQQMGTEQVRPYIACFHATH
jgi:mitochondrial import receptor subunit TOM22